MSAENLKEILVRRGPDRGHFENDWLKSYHSFSFSGYYDENFMGFQSLRVINQDWIQPKAGFPMHPHRDMEIITYIVDGSIQHQDNMGNKKVVTAGEVQVMSAGTGVVHSEYNPSDKEVLQLFQIWIEPSTRNLKPRYDQKHFSNEDKLGRLQLIVSEDGRDGSLQVAQDVSLYASVLDAGGAIDLSVLDNRAIWLQQVRGESEVDGQALLAGDAVYFSGRRDLSIGSKSGGEFIVFDLAEG